MILPRLEVIVLPEVQMEINELYDFIAIDKGLPMSARRYKRGIYKTIYSLSLTGNIFAVNYNDGLQRQYGSTVRTINYKKMTIIYVIVDDTVVVHSVKPSNTIK